MFIKKSKNFYIDENGFKLRKQLVDKKTLTVYEQLGGDNTKYKSISKDKTIEDDENLIQEYVIDGRFRRLKPYYFTYLTYCKKRWIGRKLIDVFIDEFRDFDSDFYRKTIKEGLVTVNKIPADLNTIIKEGDLICHRFFRREPPVSSKPIKIVHEDDNIVVISKPAGIPVHPSGRYRYNTITKIFEHEFKKIAHPCNRLDRLTSGLMFLAKNLKGINMFNNVLKSKTLKKTYIARVKGNFPSDSEIIVDKPIITISPKHGLNRVDTKNGKISTTVFKKIFYDKRTDTSVIFCYPLTGRTHQIRVHLQYIGHPIANDPIYSNLFVWGPDLGKGTEGIDDDVMERIEKIGKEIPPSSWMYENQDGEHLTREFCPVTNAPICSDPGINDLEIWLHSYKYEDSANSFSFQTSFPEWALTEKKKFLEIALNEALKCKNKNTQYSVGAVLIHDNEILETGYTGELISNTHAEECAIKKYLSKTNSSDVPKGTEIVTTLEPCFRRLSNLESCTDRILSLSITACYFGASEPNLFVENFSSKKFIEKNIHYVKIPDYEEKCLNIAFKELKKNT